MELLLHPKTKLQIESIIKSKPQAVLIYGPSGTGKYTVAKQLVIDILGVKDLENYPYYLEITSDKSIGIEQAHKISSFLTKKTTGTGNIRRIVLIADAHTMTNEAQNALLKTIEEPPADTMIIMTSSSLPAIKATIRSRSQELEVLPVDQPSTEQYFKGKDIKQAYLMSDGRVGLLTALLENREHPLVEAINQAKQILSMSNYERLCAVDGLAKEKEQLYLLLEGMERIALSGMRTAANNQEKPKTEKFYTLNRALEQAKQQLDTSVSPKLALTNLFLSI